MRFEMCEFLIMAKNSFNVDLQKDKFAYKIGHIISIQPDGHIWGKLECLPRFWIIKVPGMKVEEAKHLTSNKCGILDTYNVNPISIRKWKFDVNTLQSIDNEIIDTVGIISIKKDVIFNTMTLI